VESHAGCKNGADIGGTGANTADAAGAGLTEMAAETTGTGADTVAVGRSSIDNPAPTVLSLLYTSTNLGPGASHLFVFPGTARGSACITFSNWGCGDTGCMMARVALAATAWGASVALGMVHRT
jgi:hypothetical protein